MLFTSVYLANLLCSFYNCQYLRQTPVSPSANVAIDENLIKRVGRSQNDAPPLPIVNTTQGFVEGYFMKVFNRQVYAFEGIPYAEDPKGNLRFRRPVPKRPWSGIRSAKKASAECLQFNLPRYLRVVGVEGCLQLNVYSPMITDGESNPKLPAMIFIHGGSFISGRASDYGGTYLLKNDIILVTINYRLGVLGFLSTGDEEAPGNYGLHDQALAIKWVHDNIANFGGDSSKITISVVLDASANLLGQSAGAASVHLQMMSTTSVARGLFRSAISLSGSAAHHWALQPSQDARKLTHNFAKRLGCPISQGSRVLINCLRRIEPNYLVAAQNNLIEFLGFPVVLFAPVIEPNITGAFITESVESAYNNRHVAEIPYLCTNTANEGEFILMAMKNVLVLGNVVRNWALRGPLILDVRNLESITPQQAVMEIRDVYLRDVPPKYRTAIIESNVKKYAQMGSDRFFTLGNRRALKLHIDLAPTYSYIFNFKSRVGVASFFAADYNEWGVSHGEDLTVLFNNTAFSDPLTTHEKAYEVSDLLVSLVTNFVTHSAPYYTASNGSLVDVWKTIGNAEYPNFLEISEEGMKMIPDPMHETEELKVWNRLGIK